MLPKTFDEALRLIFSSSAKAPVCPCCGSKLLAIYGHGWDYDIIFCSKFACAWEHQYDTTTLIDEG